MEKKYEDQNYVLNRWYCETYMPFLEKKQNFVFMAIACYRKETGVALEIDEIREYLAQEVEEDGSVRIYDNGNWPNMNKFVQWGLKNEKVVDAYIGMMCRLQEQYNKKCPQLGNGNDISLHNLAELVRRAEEGESYEPQFVFLPEKT